MDSFTILAYFLHTMAIITNTCLIFSLCKLKKIRVISFRLVFYLSLSDVFSAIFGIALDSVTISANGSKSVNDTLRLITVFHTFFMNFSLILILVIAVDRFIHMKYLINYPRIMTRKKAVVAVVLSAIFTMHTVIVAVILPYYYRVLIIRHYDAYITYRVILSIFYILLVLSTFVVYFWTYFTITRKLATLHSLDLQAGVNNVNLENGNECTTSQSSRRPSSRPNTANDFVKGMLFVVCCLVICVLPNICFSVARTLTAMHGSKEMKIRIMKATPIVRKITYPTFILNCSLNALFFILSCSDIRIYTRDLFKRCFTAASR